MSMRILEIEYPDDLLGRYGFSYFDEAIDQDEAAGRANPDTPDTPPAPAIV